MLLYPLLEAFPWLHKGGAVGMLEITAYRGEPQHLLVFLVSSPAHSVISFHLSHRWLFLDTISFFCLFACSALVIQQD